jgi:hypothetical protein
MGFMDCIQSFDLAGRLPSIKNCVAMVISGSDGSLKIAKR